MNTDRKLILRFLAGRDTDEPVYLRIIAEGCAIGYDDAERETLALVTLGLVDFCRCGWTLTMDGRDYFETRMAE